MAEQRASNNRLCRVARAVLRKALTPTKGYSHPAEEMSLKDAIAHISNCGKCQQKIESALRKPDSVYQKSVTATLVVARTRIPFESFRPR